MTCPTCDMPNCINNVDPAELEKQRLHPGGWFVPDDTGKYHYHYEEGFVADLDGLIGHSSWRPK